MSDTTRAILLALKAAIDAALTLPGLSDPTRRMLTGARRCIANDLWPQGGKVKGL